VVEPPVKGAGHRVLQPGCNAANAHAVQFLQAHDIGSSDVIPGAEKPIVGGPEGEKLGVEQSVALMEQVPRVGSKAAF